MELPLTVRNAIEANAAAWQPSVLKNASSALTDRYKTVSGSGKNLVISEADAAVYAAVRMPATFGAVYSALKSSLDISGVECGSLLDAGSGTGACACAAAELCDLDEITCLEREKVMADLGIKLLSNCGSPLSAASWKRLDITKDETDIRADLVTESYMLNELKPEQRHKAIDKLWECTEKLLLLVEPGTKEGFEVIKEARSYLLKKGGHIAAPCPHENECRLDKNDWCHFTARIQRSRLHKLIKGGDVPYEDEKYTYIAVIRSPSYTSYSRVLRHPVTEKGRITLSLCSPDENRTVTVTKSSPIYKQARKVRCGDIIAEEM